MTHTCHARNCTSRCRPEYLMCPMHWRKVPVGIRRHVYATYRAGQCEDMQPSPEWHQAADAAIGAVALSEGCPPGKLRVREVRALLALAPGTFGSGEETMRALLAQRDGENKR